MLFTPQVLQVNGKDLGIVHVTCSIVEDLAALNGSSVCLPQFEQSEHGKAMTLLPVSVITEAR